MRRSLQLCLSLLAVLTLTAAAITTAEANQAGTTYMKINKAHGAKPTRGNLIFHGGPVQAPVAVYISWWGPEWAGGGFSTGSFSSADAQAYVTAFFNNVGGTRWGNTTKQYCGSNGCPSNPNGELAGTWNDTTAVPTSPTQTQISNAAARLAAHFNVTPGANDDFMVFTPSGHSQNGFGTQWCAYHSSSGSVSFSYIPYLPDAGASCGMNFVNKSDGSNGSGFFDGFSIVGGHEYAEAVTDPQPPSGWTDSRGAEIGDKCAWLSSGPGAATNLTFNGQVYAVQSLWSNAIGGCTTAS